MYGIIGKHSDSPCRMLHNDATPTTHSDWDNQIRESAPVFPFVFEVAELSFAYDTFSEILDLW